MRWSPRSAIGILVAGVSLLAQTNVPPAEPKAPPTSQIEEPTKNLGPPVVLTDTLGVDFNPYLSRVLHDVKQHWYELLPSSVGQQKGKVVIEFAILKDGSVAGLKVVGSSGLIAMDRPAYGSITGSNPFSPLPSEFKGPYIGLRFTFYYNLPPRNPLLAPLVEDIQQKNSRENVRSDKNAKTDLGHDVAALTELIDTGGLDATDEAGARFFRALGYSALDFLRRQDGVSPDATAAERALSDLDRIIAGKSDIPEWGITIPDVEYYAGAIAWIDLHSDDRAYSYWQRCADKGHAGCMMDLAGAYIAGWGGVKPDPTKALNLNLRAFETGNRNACAGAYGASAIAMLIYFTGVSYSEDNDPVSWVHKSYRLFDVIESRPNNKDTCGGSRAYIDEFLYRLSRGDRWNDLLAQAAQHLGSESTTRSALIKYFLGSLDVKAFETAVESSKLEGDRCYAYFHAMWYANLTKDTALVNRFYEPLSKFDSHTCPSYLVFARKVQLEGTRVQTIPQSAQKKSTPASADLFAEAQKLYREGHFEEATQKYQQLLQAQPQSPEAYAGLTRVYLKQKMVRQAHETISKGFAVVDSAPIHAALGEVLFREGKLPEAEREWMGVINAGHADARAHLGLARVSAAATQYKQAKSEIDEAHSLDPGDPDIQLYWIGSQALETAQNDPRRNCRQATDLVSTETDLLVLSGDRPNQIRGYGLPVVVNGQNSRLLLDTGAHGIVIDRKIAQRASLTKISDTTVGGFGDQHKSAGYFAKANVVKIGALEFRDCTVTVVDKGSVLGEDGLIGADVFQDFLIDLDFPNKKLQLGRLPERPDESSDKIRLTDAGEADPSSKPGTAPGVMTPRTSPPTYTSVTKRSLPSQFSFSFVPVFRFGHLLLIQTEVGDSPEPRLFAVDTGAARNLFSVSTAREISKVQRNAQVAINGLSGSVSKVYEAERTALHFANVHQYADQETALSLEAMSDEIGTEVSGVIGVLNLRNLDVTIDYRDGVVGFDFNTNP